MYRVETTKFIIAHKRGHWENLSGDLECLHVKKERGTLQK